MFVRGSQGNIHRVDNVDCVIVEQDGAKKVWKVVIGRYELDGKGNWRSLTTNIFASAEKAPALKFQQELYKKLVRAKLAV